MKRLFLVISFFLSCLVISGQDVQSDASVVLKKLLSGKRLEMTFDVNVHNSSKFSGCNGTLVYQDGAFLVKMDGFQAYSDKADMWTINEVSREAIVEKSSSYDFVSHPEKLMELFGINPKKASLSPHYDASGIPVGVELTLKDGTYIELVFTDVKQLQAGRLSDFSFNPDSLDASYVVTDLR